MATPLDTPRPNPWRTRLALVLIAVLSLGGLAGFEVYARSTVHDHEQAVLQGTLPGVRLQQLKTTITQDGLVGGIGTYDAPVYVASQFLIPAGQYDAVLLADEGTRTKKIPMVIAARDTAGHWHPASATKILARLGLHE
ncbi:MAG TPA: hypothetical protein V6D47_18375 [Oscillatoriaceae cyanobacterium]